MKLNHYIYSLIAGLVLMLSACSPDEYDMGKKSFIQPEFLLLLFHTHSSSRHR